jgi:hypothetical protein
VKSFKRTSDAYQNGYALISFPSTDTKTAWQYKDKYFYTEKDVEYEEVLVGSQPLEPVVLRALPMTEELKRRIG